MFRKILAVVAILVVLFIGVVSAQPADFTITRSSTINAPARLPFALVNDFKRWPEWSYWETLDPAMTRTFSGAEAGEGAVYHWKGNDDAGEGEMRIVESRPPGHVGIDLKFTEPMEQHNRVTITLDERDGATKVTWTMKGTNGFMGKAFALVMNLDELVGADFDKCLVKLKAVSEAQAAAEAKAAEEAP